MVLVVCVCAGVFLAKAQKSKNATWEEAYSYLLEQLSDYSDIDKMEVSDGSHEPQKINNIKDSSGSMRSDTVYSFTFRYNEEMPGLEGRLADDFVVSVDLSHIYRYNPADDCRVEFNG